MITDQNSFYLNYIFETHLISQHLKSLAYILKQSSQILGRRCSNKDIGIPTKVDFCFSIVQGLKKNENISMKQYKYQAIPCSNRSRNCKPKCCRLPAATSSKQCNCAAKCSLQYSIKKCNNCFSLINYLHRQHHFLMT